MDFTIKLSREDGALIEERILFEDIPKLYISGQRTFWEERLNGLLLSEGKYVIEVIEHD